MAGDSEPGWENRAHFLAVASRAMRHVLVDYARRQHRAKRGGDRARIPLDAIEAALETAADPSEAGSEALIALDEALRRLEQHNARQSRIVECRFFGGMAIEETAQALGVSTATVKRGWGMAQAWLHREVARVLEVGT
jgi:RNA polymerase sigma factor (TIGR02999 family)